MTGCSLHPVLDAETGSYAFLGHETTSHLRMRSKPSSQSHRLKNECSVCFCNWIRSLVGILGPNQSHTADAAHAAGSDLCSKIVLPLHYSPFAKNTLATGYLEISANEEVDCQYPRISVEFPCGLHERRYTLLRTGSLRALHPRSGTNRTVSSQSYSSFLLSGRAP